VKAVQVLLNLNGQQPLLAVDGQIGPGTQGAIDRFQRDVMGSLPPAGLVEPGSATLERLREGMPRGLSVMKLCAIFAEAPSERIERYFPALQETLRRYDIGSPLRQCHFLAQIGHESGELRYTEEIASGAAYEGRADLGNTEPGDGVRFKGRGLIQLTGRANYQAYGDAVGRDLCGDGRWTAVAEDPALCVDVAGWFWSRRGLNLLADEDNVHRITRRINGGLNGLEDRQAKLARAKFFLT
jgi:putative chitinase